MNVKQFLYQTRIDPDLREYVLNRCGVKLGTLRNISYGSVQASPKLAKNLEKHSNGLIKKEEVRPDIWA